MSGLHQYAAASGRLAELFSRSAVECARVVTLGKCLIGAVVLRATEGVTQKRIGEEVG
jgi:hypothetical protein